MGHTVFMKLRIGWFSDTPSPPMVEAEGPKIFHVQCILGRMFAYIENVCVCFVQFLHEIDTERVL